MVNGQVMGCLPQAGGELKDHWAHFQSIFLRRLCLSQIVQVPINANRTNEVIVRYRSRIDVCTVAYGLGVLALACYKTEMPKIIERWLLFKYLNGEFTPLSKPFKTKAAAGKARLKYPERERGTIGVGVIRIVK
jgi:hypothetical protein